MASQRIQRQIDRLLDEAEEAISRLDWDTVRQRAEAVLALDPHNKDGLAFLTAAKRGLAGAAPALPDPSISSVASRAPGFAVTTGQPAAFANGRYQVKKFLGEGAKKKVYLAHDVLLDRDVAFALIKAEGLDDTARTRITREAQAMGRLGSNPNIVMVYDLGQDNGQPYMVTELMTGGDVGRLIEQAPDHRIPLDQAVAIAKSVCQALEFAHFRGIVHRDLKPSNVWLNAPSSASGESAQAQGTSKIGDFGLAVSLDRSRLTQQGMMVGTAAYMPPEQAMGGVVTPRADLYSLGALLYEMVTGRPPFLGDDPVAVIGQHINTPPVAPTWHNPQCPRPLETLILRLLAKDPSQRPESAKDVLAALESKELLVSADVPAPQADEVNALDRLAGDVFVGRQREMGELKAALEDALSGRGRVVMLVGEPGIGKTRMTQELATYAALRGAQVLFGRCYEERGTPPYWAWVQAIRSYVRDRELDQLRSEMGAHAADIAGIVSDVKERLPDLHLTPPLDDPEQARFRLFDSVAGFLKRASQAQPLMLVLDDLHWADKPSLRLLEFVVRELTGTRLLLVGAYRDVGLSRHHPLGETLGVLSRESGSGGFQRLVLPGLSRQEVDRFIEVTSGISPSPGLVSAVHTQTEGNPLFVTEVVRLLAQEGHFASHRASESELEALRIPQGVREVIGRRLNRLSDRCNQALTTASVIGREFGLEPLRLLIDDMSQDQLVGVLEEALAARLIEELPHTAGRYRFIQPLTQQTLMEELSSASRGQLHARIGEALEALYGVGVSAHAAELAYHFAQAQGFAGTGKLVRYSLPAGEQALAGYAYEEAVTHFQRGLAAKEGGATDGETAALLFGLGRAQAATLQRHQLGEALGNLSRAFDYYAQIGDVPRAVSVAEYPLPLVVGHRAGVTPLIERALALVPPDSHEAGRLLSNYGRVLGIEEGNYDRAQEAFGRAVDIAQRQGDVSLEMRTLGHGARIDAYNHQWEASLEKSLRTVELAERIDDIRSEVESRYRASSALLVLGDLPGTERHAVEALDLAERLRDRYWLTTALWCNENACRIKADWKSAREFSERGLAIWPNDPRLLGTRALLEYEVGSFKVGEAYLERLLKAMSLTTPGASLDYSMVACVIPLVARITGSLEMLEVAEKAAEVVLSTPSATSGMANDVRSGLALLAAHRGDVAGARDQYSALESERGHILFASLAGDRLLGLLARTMGKLDDAMAHLEDALAFCRNAGYRPELAWACSDCADTLLQRNGPADRTRAITLLDEALTIARDLSMRPLLERVLALKLKIQGISSIDLKTSIDTVASAVSSEQPDLRSHAAPDGTVTILFSDIEGSTTLTERLGDRRMQEVLRAHNSIIRRQAGSHGGFEVKSMGDGFMLAFSSARRGLQCAIAIQRGFTVYNEEHPEEPILVRIGLHTGEAIKEADDFYGKNVILASRIAGQAQGGQILVSSLLKELTESAGEFQFGEGHELGLKGLANLALVYPVLWG